MNDAYPTCGFAAVCGRKAHHRGQHGGWRPYPPVSGVAPEPVQRHWEGGGGLGETFTAREIEVLAEYVEHGSYKDVATCLGASVQTMKNHGMSILSKTGAVSMAHALLIVGWVRLPENVSRHGEAVSA